MGRRILKKKYYRIILELTSPLSVGSGENAYTDRDLLRDSRGIPYIPASAIAGLSRNYFLSGNDPTEYGAPKEDENAGTSKTANTGVKAYFGYVSTDGSGERVESTLVFYDAFLLPEDEKKYHISVRDSVKLDEYKTAEDGAKFDMEILEPGVRFCTFLEQNFYKEDEEDYGKKIISYLNTEQAVFGAKNTRGYGAFTIALQELCEAEFDLRNPDDVRAWINFDICKKSCWKNCVEITPASGGENMLRLKLRQKGGISIRRYTTQAQAGQTMPDYTQLSLHAAEEAKTPVPVIPGTSWAGAFRSQMGKLQLSPEDERCLFGYADGEGRKAKSVIMFGESKISGGSFQTISRNAIDRFTGGTVDGALFTEETYYGGTTELCISFRRNHIPKAARERMSAVLAAALLDMHHGFLAVGGETSIGRGLFEIEQVNKIPVKDKDDAVLYDLLIHQVRALWE